MSPPVIKQSRESWRYLLSNNNGWNSIANMLKACLREYPHFIVLKGLPPSESPTVAARFLSDISRSGSVKPDLKSGRHNKIDFHRIEVNEKIANSKGGATNYSRTHQMLEQHTDCSFMAEPYEMLAMQMVRADPAGGDSIIVAIEDIERWLPDEVKDILQQPIFPFGKHKRPILFKSNAKSHIRYYRTQIETSCESEGYVLDASAVAAMDLLDDVLKREETRYQCHLESGDIILVHNNRALHGRSAFSADSERLMYRLRAHAIGLS